MCIQDVRIGRAKATNIGKVGTISAAEALPVRGNNPNRAGLSVSITPDPQTDPTATVTIRAFNADGPAVGVVSVQRPFWRGSVEEYGDGITGEVWISCVFGTSVPYVVSESVWLTDPGEL